MVHKFSIREDAEIIRNSSDIISDLMDTIEEQLPDYYYKSNLILKADEWLKWVNGEITPENKKEFFNC